MTGTPGVERTSASAVLLWMRPDLPRQQAMDYWRGPHSQLVARSPGFRDYRQHHFAATGDGLWPPLDGVQTTIPDERRVDGMPEVTFTSPVAPLKGLAHGRLVQADEKNVFARTVLYVTPPLGGRWAGNSDGVGARTVVLLRRRTGQDSKAVARFVNTVLVAALAAEPGLREVRSMVLAPWKEKQWPSRGVAHDNPERARFHACLVLGAPDRAALLATLDSVNTSHGAALREHLSALHAYDVTDTYTYVQDGRPTLPRTLGTPTAERKYPLQPVRRTVRPLPERARQRTGSSAFPAVTRLPLPGRGAEDVVVDDQGRLLCGVQGGALLRLDPDSGRVETLASTGGRPLGLEVLPDGRVLVCDAHRGLLRLDPATGRLETLVQHVDGIPLRFCSNATAAADGTIWFTESTSRYDFEQYLGAFLEHWPSGRLLRRDPDGTVDVVLTGLDFPNGLALTPDGQALLLAETASACLSRVALTGPAAGTRTVVADDLPGVPDNLSRFTGGRAWVALAAARSPQLATLAGSPPWLRRALWRLPLPPRPDGDGTTWVMAFDADGRQLADLQTDQAPFDYATGVAQRGDDLFLASPGHDALLQVHGAAVSAGPPRQQQDA